MAENSKIEWTDATFNPWIGCTKVSPGCDDCYAKADFEDRKHRVIWGAGQARSRTSPGNWKMPLRWNRQHAEFFLQHGRRQRVFCASLADVFDNEVQEEWRDDLWELIERCANLDFLLLTKRIGNVAKMMPAHLASFPRNVWLGATIVNQEEADRDIPKLLATPARVRFLLMEPLLGPVNLWLPTRTWETGRGPYGTEAPALMCDHCCNGDRCDDPTHYERGRPDWRVRCPHCRGTGRGKPIDWVIVGGESGHGARPMHPNWPRSLRDQCKAAGVPFLFKQHGEYLPCETYVDAGHRAGESAHVVEVDEGFGGLPDERHYTVIKAHGAEFVKVGKKAAGRLLDGVTHDGYPEICHA
jgi:protein gp37